MNADKGRNVLQHDLNGGIPCQGLIVQMHAFLNRLVVEGTDNGADLDAGRTASFVRERISLAEAQPVPAMTGLRPWQGFQLFFQQFNIDVAILVKRSHNCGNNFKDLFVIVSFKVVNPR